MPTRPRTSLLPALLLAGSLLRAGDASAVLQVTSTTPTAHQLGVAADLAEIWAFFSSPLAPLPTDAVRVAGTMSGLHGGNVVLMDNVIRFQNLSEPFFAGEMVVVSYSKEIEGVSGELLPGGHIFAFTVASGAGSMNWSRRVGYEAADIPYFIHGGDLDNDGHPDVAAPNEGTHNVSVFLNTSGIGSFTSRSEYPVGNVPSSVFGEDFDNDGDQDLATANIQSGTVSVLLNNGDGTFAPGGSYAAGLQCRQIHGGDFDGDNDVDLCATSTGNDRVHVYLNAGDGTFVPQPPIYTVSNGPFAIRAADLDRDGHLDIAVACFDGDSLTVLLNDGLGAFHRSGTYLAGDGPWCLNGNDMDGDGDFDLTTVASRSNRLIVLFNDGSGAFPVRHQVQTGAYPLGVFAADLDGDGDVDATSSNFSGDTVGIYRNPGNGLLTLQSTLPVADSGSYTWAHDLDGDGDLDLSVVDENADSLFVFYNGNAAEAPGDSGPVPLIAGRMQLSLFPNPVDRVRGATIRVLDGKGPASIHLIRVDGRRLGRIWAGDLMEGETSIHWDLRLDAGGTVSPGRYLLELRAPTGSVSREVLILGAR